MLRETKIDLSYYSSYDVLLSYDGQGKKYLRYCFELVGGGKGSRYRESTKFSTPTVASHWSLFAAQARIHTGFHRFTEIGQNFQNKKIDMYTF